MGDIRSLSEYLRRLNARLVCPNAYRKRFLSEAQRMADDYRQGNLDASDEEVIEFLGDPQELAATFLDSIDPDQLRRYNIHQTWFKRGIAIAAVMAIFILSAWCFYLKHQPQTIEVVETLVIYPEVDL